ncbi:MAG TPA: methylenetetrahydrofolate reductase C-terminal domain-containing protein [Desulfosalsimonadaceae bacterium]|nr:methylenetetrahydrofolate reductase C-terminal domain-containing protein [Desulfosalsimonadaceae bacterium]
MIKAKPKPLDEILEYIGPYENVLIAGCGGCVSVCLAGGQKEVNILKSELDFALRDTRENKQITGYTVERQCNAAYLGEIDAYAETADCMLSMACGAGAQLLAERYPHIPVFPAVNTIAIGVDRDIGLYEERCRACGECVLAYTGGICPVTRCAKGLFNGPCGGTQGDRCEISPEVPCAWHEIFERLKAQGRLEDILKIRKPMEWRDQIQRKFVQKGYENRYLQED